MVGDADVKTPDFLKYVDETFNTEAKNKKVISGTEIQSLYQTYWLDLRFCRVGKQISKLLIILIGYQGYRKSSCAYVLGGEEETFKTTLGIGISNDLSARPSSGPASLR